MSIIQENASTVHELDEVLYAGNDLFRVRIGEMQSNVKSFLQMLSFEELPYERSENVLNLSQGSKLLFSSCKDLS